MGKLTLSIDDTLKSKAKIFAKKNDTSLSEMVQLFLQESISEERAKKSDMDIIDKLFGIWKGRDIESQNFHKKVWKN